MCSKVKDDSAEQITSKTSGDNENAYHQLLRETQTELALVNEKVLLLNEEKQIHADELIIANKELIFQNGEKEKRAAELFIANRDLTLQIKSAADLIHANGTLQLQNGENKKREMELTIANDDLAFQNGENGKRAAQLIAANDELAFQIDERGKRAAELLVANRELIFQNNEKEKRAAELIIANKELIFQNEEKGKRAAELVIANEELAFQNSEREKRAAELVIANKELVFQNEEKEKHAAELLSVNEALETFSYVSSHDLQEPLRKIQTLSNRIVEIDGDNLSAKGREYLDRMQSAAARMRLLITDLLTFSCLNKADRKFEETNLNTIIAEVINELTEVIEEKHVTIEATDLCTVNIIPFQFRQIMYNLISNALKFSKPEVPPHIVIRSEIAKGLELNEVSLLPETVYCHISISDNGIGFNPEYKDRIFEVFQKLHDTRQYSGSGIGLAIVKKVIDNHNGFIRATGKLDHGATFNIYIPVSQK